MARMQPPLTKAESTVVDQLAELIRTKRTDVLKNALAVYSWFVRQAVTGSQFIGGGIGIHWEEIDEDISVASLLKPEKFMRLANSYEDSPVKKTKSGRALKKRTTRKSANKR